MKIFLDFEFNQTKEKDLNLVCAVLSTGETNTPFWLHNNPKRKEELKKEILKFHQKGAIFVAYAATAESRAIATLGINPAKLRWIDLMLEYRMLTNHNNTLAYGRHLINGKEVKTHPPKPKWQMTEEEREERDMSKPSHSLASCAYKLLGVKLDTEHKTQMRNLILSNPQNFTPVEKKVILEYCASDVAHLPQILKAQIKHYRELHTEWDLKALPKEMLVRGEYAARTALMERIGYPVNVKWVKRFVEKVPEIMREMSEDINSQFPKFPPFKWNNQRQAYSMDLKTIRSWIDKKMPSNWMRTETGLLSVSADAFEEKFHYKHDYPRGNFGAQMLRFFKFKKSLNGFLPKTPNAKNKETFLDYVGSDGFCRPYMNIFGAQSGRSQPKATSFIPLKAAWMRSFIQPPKGYVIVGMDYSSEEFLISALVARDIEMVKAYKSGDPYLYFAIGAGAAPPGATKKTHKKIREPFKSTTLGVGYGMQEISLAAKLTQDTGQEYTPEDARVLIDQFYELYSNYKHWCEAHLQEYREKKMVKMPCGWTMYGDNDNFRSVNNVAIQGRGASVMRKAVALCQDRGVQIIFTNHDALYALVKIENLKKKIDIMWDSMIEAFCHYFDGRAKEHAACIRLEGEMWGPDLSEGEFTTPKGRILKTEKIHIDERAVREYQQFSKYFIAAKASK